MPSPGMPPMWPWAVLASQPFAWKTALMAGKAIDFLPTRLLPVPAVQAWARNRTIPKWRGGEFRKWLKNRGRPVEPRKQTSLVEILPETKPATVAGAVAKS